VHNIRQLHGLQFLPPVPALAARPTAIAAIIATTIAVAAQASASVSARHSAITV